MAAPASAIRLIMKLSTLLDWASTEVRDFPYGGPLQLETWQVVGKRFSDSQGQLC